MALARIMKGLGMVNQIDLEKVIPDDEKTIAAGGIDPLGEARKQKLENRCRLCSKK